MDQQGASHADEHFEAVRKAPEPKPVPTNIVNNIVPCPCWKCVANGHHPSLPNAAHEKKASKLEAVKQTKRKRKTVPQKSVSNSAAQEVEGAGIRKRDDLVRRVARGDLFPITETKEEPVKRRPEAHETDTKAKLAREEADRNYLTRVQGDLFDPKKSTTIQRVISSKSDLTPGGDDVDPTKPLFGFAESSAPKKAEQKPQDVKPAQPEATPKTLPVITEEPKKVSPVFELPKEESKPLFSFSAGEAPKPTGLFASVPPKTEEATKPKPLAEIFAAPAAVKELFGKAEPPALLVKKESNETPASSLFAQPEVKEPAKKTEAPTPAPLFAPKPSPLFGETKPATPLFGSTDSKPLFAPVSDNNPPLFPKNTEATPSLFPPAEPKKQPEATPVQPPVEAPKSLFGSDPKVDLTTSLKNPAGPIPTLTPTPSIAQTTTPIFAVPKVADIVLESPLPKPIALQTTEAKKPETSNPFLNFAPPPTLASAIGGQTTGVFGTNTSQKSQMSFLAETDKPEKPLFTFGENKPSPQPDTASSNLFTAKPLITGSQTTAFPSSEGGSKLFGADSQAPPKPFTPLFGGLSGLPPTTLFPTQTTDATNPQPVSLPGGTNLFGNTGLGNLAFSQNPAGQSAPGIPSIFGGLPQTNPQGAPGGNLFTAPGVFQGAPGSQNQTSFSLFGNEKK